MKKIGKEVLMINTRKNNSRNGEGDFIRLNNGDIMFAFTEFITEDNEDNGISQISAVISQDEGDTWSERKLLFSTPEDAKNIMCVNFLRMNNGDIGVFYLIKYENPKHYITVVLRRSSDEGKTWSEPIICIDDKRNYCLENARIIKLKSGRIIIPLNEHICYGGEYDLEAGNTLYYISDDDGKTFYDSGNFIGHPFGEAIHGLQETGVVEFNDGKIFSFSRTINGSQFESFSEDGGMTWTKPVPSSIFYSPLAPMHVRHLGDKYTVAVFNPIPNYPGKPNVPHVYAGRTPLLALFCKGDGSDFWDREKIKGYFLEVDEDNQYSYPTTIVGDDYFLCAYYHSNNTGENLNSCKIVKVKFSEFDK